MKKKLLLIASVLLTATAGAQTIDIHKADGTTVSYPASEVNYIGFTAKQEGGSEEPSTPGTAPAGAVAVDLGLPSGTKWANMNVGASKPEDYGLFFAWGETVGYGSDTNDGHFFGWQNYKWCNGSEDTMTKYCTDSSYGTVDNKTVLDLEDDAAYVNWGSSWRMPTIAEIVELLNNTTHVWTTQNGVSGRKFTSKTNGNSIFLPAAGECIGSAPDFQASRGHYWSSSLYVSYLDGALYLFFFSEHAGSAYDFRYHGYSVRPVLRN